jgi:hypothetical protein
MRTKYYLLLVVALFTFCAIGMAQNPIATLQHKGQTKVFNGQSSFAEAYSASETGDTINLSVGGFTPPPSISKGITVVGAGHFPDSPSVSIRTIINGALIIGEGSDNFHFEGLCITDNIYWNNVTINHGTVSRCRFTSFSLYSYNMSTLNNFSFVECFINGNVDCCNSFISTNNMVIRQCAIQGNCSICGTNTVIDGNIFFNASGGGMNLPNAIIKNNIILSPQFNGADGGGKFYYNNLFVASSVNFGSNGYESLNYFNVPQSEIFVNQSGSALDYTHDYHLKNPEKYIGTDGTQVGLYGGVTPFKEKGLPFNPQITSKSIAKQTDADGNLNVNVTVKAQEN